MTMSATTMDPTRTLAAVGNLAAALGAFGTDWLYVVVPLAALVLALSAFARRAPARPRGPLLRASYGAAVASGLPTWCAGPLVVLLGALIIAVQGFLWDVAWHIDIGRDEFLFSPPHLCLLIGISLIGVAGLLSAWIATRDRADVGWRVDRWRVPYAAAVMLVASGAAVVGFGVDELWHWAYGLDVTMWSPPHLTMISAAAFAPLAGWLLLAEAGPGAGRTAPRGPILWLTAAAALVGLSAWQLEFDLGVPQWQQLYHPVLVAFAGAFALCAARAALGRGGALIAASGFILIRGALTLLTAGVWGLSMPRFVPYLASAVVVEATFALARNRSARSRHLLTGAAVATLGLAGEWLTTHVWSWHPWQPSMLGRISVAAAAAVAAAVLGGTFGRIVSFRPSGIRWPAVVLCLATLVAALAIPLPRTVPEAEVRVVTTPAGAGAVQVEAYVEPATAISGPERFEVMAWQGGGHANVAMLPVAPGHFRSETAVPVGGTWKTNLRLGQGSHVAAVPVALPADPAIGAGAVPLVPERVAPFQADAAVLLREATEGPAWPAVVGYSYVAVAIAVVIGLLVAGSVGLERRRRGRGWTDGTGSLEDVRVLLSGAEGGIGSAARAALEAQGARVVGIDLHATDPRTIVADVTDSAAVAGAVDEAARRLGGIDVVVANAGIGVAHPATAAVDDRLRAVVDVNLFGSWNVAAAAAEHLLAAQGQVVVVGSGLAVATMPYAGAYSASKRAVAAWADVLRMESRGRLTVSVVQPAFIRTAIHDGPTAQGVSLDGLVRCESVADAAAAIVTACETGRRELGSSPVTSAQLWLARRAPALTDRVLHRRWQRRDRALAQPPFTTPSQQDQGVSIP